MAQIKVLLVILLLCVTSLADGFEARCVPSGDVEIWTETFGQPQGRPLLLVAGARLSGLVWTDDFCDRFARQGYFVIRYDHRDVGKSSIVDYQQCPYILDDMVEDALAILDAYGIDKVHIVGQSMGGYIGQLIAIDHPNRLLSLVSLMSSPDHRVSMAAIKGENTSDYTLPPPDKKALQAWEIIKKLPNSTREEKIEIELENLKLFSGIEGFDEKELRGLAEKLVDRTRDFEARYHHRQAMNAASSRIERLRNVHVPTLVIHGGNDAVFPVAHGVATAQAIPNAKLVIIPAMGHVVCKHFEDQLVSLITEFHECPIANERSRAISF